MSQAGYTPISLYYSATTTNVPLAADLVAGELAINTVDGKLFYKDSSNVVQVLGTKGGVGSSTTTQVLYNSSGLVVGSSALTFDGTNFGLGAAWTTNPMRASQPQYFQYGAASTGLVIASDASAFFQTIRYSTNSSGTTFIFSKGRGTYASPLAVASGDNIGSTDFRAYGGTNSRTIAQINGVVDTYTSDTNISSYLTFLTSPSGSTSATERLRVSQTGAAVTGAISSTLDATIHGVTVGLGTGSGTQNTTVGISALTSNVTGAQNTAVGYQSLKATTGNYSTAVGSQTLEANTGDANTAVGQGAMYSNVSGANNSALGRHALLSNLTGTQNTAVGYQSLFASDTNNNTAVGYQAGYSGSTSTDNTFLGNQAGFAVSTGTGRGVFIGSGAGLATTTGLDNVMVGYQAGVTNISGASNVYIGGGSYGNTQPAGYLATGSKNTFVGYSAGASVTTGASNVILGGYTGSAAPISATGSNYIVLSDGDGNVRQTITPQGYVGIGITNPTQTLQTYDNSNAERGVVITNAMDSTSASALLRLTAGTASGSILRFPSTHSVKPNELYITNVGTVSPITFATQDTERMRIGSTGDVTVTSGNLIPATAAKGINFTANTAAAGMTSQLLNWYEEGTWTPGYTGWSINPSTSNAQYTRIGRAVTITMLCAEGVTTGGTITGLPFTSKSTQGATATIRGTNSNLNAVGCIADSSTSIVNISPLTATGYYWTLSVTYIV